MNRIKYISLGTNSVDERNGCLLYKINNKWRVKTVKRSMLFMRETEY